MYTSGSLHSSLNVQLDPENMGIAFGISLLSCIEADTLCHFYFRLMAAIFDFRHTQTSYSIATSLSVLPDPENMGIAVGISFLCCLQAEI